MTMRMVLRTGGPLSCVHAPRLLDRRSGRVNCKLRGCAPKRLYLLTMQEIPQCSIPGTAGGLGKSRGDPDPVLTY
jgi:hypothetical protein